MTSYESKWIPEPNTGCWLWLAAVGSHGYGMVWNGKKVVLAHRFSYEREVAKIPAQMTIDHLCKTRICINPDHMELVTNSENVRRAMHERRNKARCVHGHGFFEDNDYRRPNGFRKCRICNRMAEQRKRKSLTDRTG